VGFSPCKTLPSSFAHIVVSFRSLFSPYIKCGRIEGALAPERMSALLEWLLRGFLVPQLYLALEAMVPA
jgi:hypothetical protein